MFYLFYFTVFFSGTQTDESASDEDEPDSELTVIKAELEVVKAEVEAAREKTATAQAAVLAAEVLTKSAQAAESAAKAETRFIKAQLHESVPKIHKFGVERFSKDNDLIKFYTGFPSYQHFFQFYEFARPCAEHMKYVYSAGTQESRPAARTMLIIDELFLFLVRLRLGLFEQDLADRFLIHISSVSRKITTWANYLYFLLGSQPIWPSRQQVNHYMPENFKALYPNTRVIIDCTEMFVQTPSSLLLQSQMYSSYKSNTTLKGLLGIAPHGAVTFVSSLYTGSISDKEITRCSGILDLLEPRDSVMADKGFDIEALLNTHGVGLNIPPLLQARGQFTMEQVVETKTIAKLRIHVERAIRRIKEFHIFDSDVPLNLVGSINQIYTIVCLLTNFQGPLIMKAAK